MTNQRLREVTAELNRTTSLDIVGVGFGYKETGGKTISEKCIVFTVKEKKPLSEIPESERIPSELIIDGETFKTDIVEGEFYLQAFVDCSPSDPDFYTWQTVDPPNRGKIRPLQGGISVTNYSSLFSYVGTLGFIAVDNDTNSLVGVTNNHVVIDDAFYTSERSTNVGDAVTNISEDISTQPNESSNRSASNSIGAVKKYQPIYPYPTSNLCDAACIALSQTDPLGNTVIDTNESWKQLGLTGVTSPPRFATTSEIDTALEEEGRVFYSSGRTTGAKGEGYTKLYCIDSSLSVNLNYKLQGTNQLVTMNEGFELRAKNPSTPEGDWCEYPSNSGDSGSAILTEINGEYVIIGLLYAGRKTLFGLGPGVSTICCRIDNVAAALNISAWDGTLNGISFSDTTNVEKHIVAGLSSDKSIDVNGKTYWQVGATTDSAT